MQDIQRGSAAALVDSASIFNETAGPAALVGDILILQVLNINILYIIYYEYIKYLLLKIF